MASKSDGICTTGTTPYPNSLCVYSSSFMQRDFMLPCGSNVGIVGQVARVIVLFQSAVAVRKSPVLAARGN